MITKNFKVSGMCCPNCVTHIQNALEKVGQFEKIDVQVEQSLVSLDLKETIEDRVLIEAINNAGHYHVVEE
ncbi:MAG TPA: heavy-metal-associated domain-containing protein [Edaphocola sp.]|nr:heavy-metal-associated domain-containing protein [Edaphocola sp.]